MLASAVIERRGREAVFAYSPNITFSAFEPRNSKWGEFFQGSTTPTLGHLSRLSEVNTMAAPVSICLRNTPRMVVLWAGYPFSKDYSQGRGHYYAVEDIRTTLRTGAPSEDQPSPLPNTCWSCKSPDVPRLISTMGAADFYSGTWDTKGSEIINPIGCSDCHDSKTMNLHISRPALLEAFQNMGRDISKYHRTRK